MKTTEHNVSELIYLSSSTFFDNSANSVHVAKMCSALAKRDINVGLYTYRSKKLITEAYNEYNIHPKVVLKEYKFSRSKFKPLQLILIMLETILVGSQYKRASFYYGRHLLLLYFLKQTYKVSAVGEVHALANTKLGAFIMRKVLLSLDAVVVITEALKDDLINEYKLNDIDIIVLPDGADPSNSITKQIKVNNRLKVGYVGRLYAGRGIELIISLAKLMPEFDFVIVGATDNDYKRFGESFLQTNLKVIDYLPNSQLDEYYSDFDIVIAPYHKRISVSNKKNDTSRWASPLKLFEYMSHGKCILVSDLEVFKEVLTNEYNCLFCEAENVNDWVKKIKLVSSDPTLRRRIAKNAYDDFIKNYTWEIRVKKLLSYLTENRYVSFINEPDD